MSISITGSIGSESLQTLVVTAFPSEPLFRFYRLIAPVIWFGQPCSAWKPYKFFAPLLPHFLPILP